MATYRVSSALRSAYKLRAAGSLLTHAAICSAGKPGKKQSTTNAREAEMSIGLDPDYNEILWI